MSEATLKFEFEKETKNTVRFKEVVEGEEKPVVGTLYVNKSFAGSCKEIEVSLTKKG